LFILSIKYNSQHF